MTQDIVTNLQAQFPELSFQERVLLAPYTYMKVGGPAALFVEINKRSDLVALCAYCFHANVPTIVLGGASNTVIPDAGVDRLVIWNRTSVVEIHEKSPLSSEVYAESGVITAQLSKRTADAGLTGMEYFVGVPGTIGGAIYNNSHFTAHDLVGNYLVSVDVCTSSGKEETWGRDMLDLGYDHSIFHSDPAVILSATFFLQNADPVVIQERILAAARKRVATQPIGTPSTGCMFRNPAIDDAQYAKLSSQLDIPEGAIKEVDGQKKIAAGFLIDKAGLKGKSVGGAAVSTVHATYIVNTGNATASDVDALATQVTDEVLSRFGIQLEREVFFLS